MSCKIFSGTMSNYMTWKDGGITAAPFLRLAEYTACSLVRSMHSSPFSSQSANTCEAPTLCKHCDGGWDDSSEQNHKNLCSSEANILVRPGRDGQTTQAGSQMVLNAVGKERAGVAMARTVE